MVKCKQCGNKFDEHYGGCPRCGCVCEAEEKLTEVKPPAEFLAAFKDYEDEMPAAKKKSKSKLFLIIGIIAVLIVAGIIVGIIFADSGKDSNTVEESKLEERSKDEYKDPEYTLGTIVASGECGEDGDNVTWELDDNGLLVISGSGVMKDYSSNSEIPWYNKHESIKTIIIKNGITSIGDCAFEHCDNLTSITIPDSVTSIGDWSFFDCDSLTSVTISESVTFIGIDAFSDCKNLTSIEVDKYNKSYCLEDGILYSTDKTKLLFCPPGKKSIHITDNVTTIASGAFMHRGSLTSIEVDIYNQSYCSVDGVLYSKDKTELLCCPGGRSGTYTIPDGVESIRYSAFSNCESITGITIPDSVTSIGINAFSFCTSIKTITIPDSVTSIEKYAFSMCTSLTSITIPDGVTSIEERAFYNCTSLTSITIPDSVTSIGDCAFYECTSLTSITIPDGVTSIGEGAFYHCTSLTSITIPDGVTSIGDYAFSGCESLTSITIPDGVTSIGEGAFYHCTNLTSITISGSVTSIGDYAFDGCTSLTSITIPDSVTSIGAYAFYSWTSSQTVYIKGRSSAPSGWSDDWNNNCNAIIVWNAETDNTGKPEESSKDEYKDPEYTLGAIVDSGDCGKYGNNVTWQLDDNGLLVISGSGVMKDYSAYSEAPWYNERKSIKTIIIKNGITSIGASAFEHCYNLTSIIIPDSMTSIGDWSFFSCDSLTSVTISESVTDIGIDAFSGCKNLTSIEVDTYNKSYCLADGILYSKDKTKLLFCPPGKTSLHIADSVTNIASGAFMYRGSLTSIEVDTYNKSYCSVDGVLYSKDKTELLCCPGGRSGTYTIPDGVKSIGYSAFYHCESITGITIPDSVTSIGMNAFLGCTGLTGITIPDSVTSIGAYAFSFCTSIKTITIPNSVTNIGRYLFYSWTSSQTVYIKGRSSAPSGWDNDWNNDCNAKIVWNA